MQKELLNELHELRSYQMLMENKIIEYNNKIEDLTANLNIFSSLVTINSYIIPHISQSNLYDIICDVLYGILGIESCSIYKYRDNLYEHIAGELLEDTTCLNYIPEGKITLNKQNSRYYLVNTINDKKGNIIFIILTHTNKEVFSIYTEKFLELFCSNISLYLENHYLYEQLRFFAERDSLTGLYNRRTFYSIVNNKLSNNSGYYIAFLDIDHFKKINDTYGHDIGDLVLKEVASILKSYESEMIVPSRFGGEEFVLFVDSSVDLVCLLDNIRNRIKSLKFNSGDKEFSITISIGATSNKGSLQKQ